MKTTMLLNTTTRDALLARAEGGETLDATLRRLLGLEAIPAAKPGRPRKVGQDQRARRWPFADMQVGETVTFPMWLPDYTPHPDWNPSAMNQELWRVSSRTGWKFHQPATVIGGQPWWVKRIS